MESEDRHRQRISYRVGQNPKGQSSPPGLMKTTIVPQIALTRQERMEEVLREGEGSQAAHL